MSQSNNIRLSKVYQYGEASFMSRCDGRIEITFRGTCRKRPMVSNADHNRKWNVADTLTEAFEIAQKMSDGHAWKGCAIPNWETLNK